jgi:hypothetical protein
MLWRIHKYFILILHTNSYVVKCFADNRVTILNDAKVGQYPIFEQRRHDVTAPSLHNQYSRLGVESYQHGGCSTPR